MTVRNDQKEKRRQEILFAGLRLFIQKGYFGTTIKDIAGSVGMSVGLLFHYFASKEELYLELIQLGIEGPMRTMQPTQLEPLSFFQATAEQILNYIKTDQFVANMFVLMNQAYCSEDVPNRAKEMMQEFDIYTPTSLTIRQGQLNGTIREGDPMALTIAYWGAIQGVAEIIAMDQSIPCPEGRWIADILRNPK